MIDNTTENLYQTDGNTTNDSNNVNTRAENQEVLNSINESIAIRGEEEGGVEKSVSDNANYETLTLEQLNDVLSNLVSSDKISTIKEEVEQIKNNFQTKYDQLIESTPDLTESENVNDSAETEFLRKLKAKFDQQYAAYTQKKNAYFKSLQQNLKSNLEQKLAIVEELKGIVNSQESIKDSLKKFNELREQWKNTGAIPRDKYNHVWNNYHFYVESFYDHLHLDREARDLEFKSNLEQKQKIILRVAELLDEEDINKSFRELQDLHKIWKEDIGPVPKEERDELWNLFSDLTKKMHDKREAFYEKLRTVEAENLKTKLNIIAEIEDLATVKVSSHANWLEQIKKTEQLREAFYSTGKVPAEVNEQTWASFKTSLRKFNSLKNSFYKNIKGEQNENLAKKNALIAKAKGLQDSTDFETTTPVMKRIQEEWKQIGHVPRKYSDSTWKDFREACNHYFDKLKEQKNEAESVEIESFENKKNYLETLKNFELSGEHKSDLSAIMLHIENWKGFGRVPSSKKQIEDTFNKIMDSYFDQLSLSKKETDMLRFTNRIDMLTENNDTQKIENEKIFLTRKIEEVQNEIFQLENNIQFFTNTKNVKKENSIIVEVRKNIDLHKESLSVWKEKLAQIRAINLA